MKANDFGAWDRAVALGEEAIRNASPLLQSALEGGMESRLRWVRLHNLAP
jgi:hypothetical protein